MAEATPRSARQGRMLRLPRGSDVSDEEIVRLYLVHRDPQEYTRTSFDPSPETYSGVGVGWISCPYVLI